MKSRILTLLVLLCTGMFVADNNSLQAQQQTQQQTQQQAAAEPEADLTPAEIETPANVPEDTDLILADIDEEENEDNLRNGRFIPTEEISQDLGVSFPVDI